MCVKQQAASLQLVQVLQPREYDLFARLLNLSSKKDLVQNSINLFHAKHQQHVPPSTLPMSRMSSYLVEIEHQVQLAHIAKELI